MNPEIEWQVSNRTLSMKLKKLGVSQESVFFWVVTGNDITQEGEPKIWELKDNHNGTDNWCSAFTVAELGRIMEPVLTGHSEAENRSRLLIHLLETNVMKMDE